MKYGLIGEHLEYSLSAQMHSVPYELKELHPDGLTSFIGSRDFLGLNVTMPYKTSVIPLLDFLSPDAVEAGAVNTIVNRNGVLEGYNTDIEGFRLQASSLGVSYDGCRAVVLGRGGAARAVRVALRRLGALRVDFAVRGTPGPGEVPFEAIPDGYDVLVNATPVGMWPDSDSTPVDPTRFRGLRAVLDCVYNPSPTRLVREARALGIPSADGLKMLREQARLSDLLFLRNEHCG